MVIGMAYALQLRDLLCVEGHVNKNTNVNVKYILAHKNSCKLPSAFPMFPGGVFFLCSHGSVAHFEIDQEILPPPLPVPPKLSQKEICYQTESDLLRAFLHF